MPWLSSLEPGLDGIVKLREPTVLLSLYMCKCFLKSSAAAHHSWFTLPRHSYDRTFNTGCPLYFKFTDFHSTSTSVVSYLLDKSGLPSGSSPELVDYPDPRRMCQRDPLGSGNDQDHLICLCTKTNTQNQISH